MNELIVKLQSLLASLEAAKAEAEAAKAALESAQGDKIYSQAEMDQAIQAKEQEKQQVIADYEAKLQGFKQNVLNAIAQQQNEENASEANLVNIINSL